MHALISAREAWDSYDTQFLVVVQTYNDFLRKTPGFSGLNCQIIKALSWVECGAVNPQWATKPMQIGVPGDPGLHQILGTESGKLVLPPTYKAILTMANAVVTGNLNIEAGVGYFFWSFARFGYLADPVPPRALPSLGTGVLSYKNGTQTHGGHHAMYRSVVKKHYAVTGWRPITLAGVAAHYNGGGDGNYLAKLEYCFDVVTGKTVPQESKPAAAR